MSHAYAITLCVYAVHMTTLYNTLIQALGQPNYTNPQAQMYNNSASIQSPNLCPHLNTHTPCVSWGLRCGVVSEFCCSIRQPYVIQELQGAFALLSRCTMIVWSVFLLSSISSYPTIRYTHFRLPPLCRVQSSETTQSSCFE